MMTFPTKSQPAPGHLALPANKRGPGLILLHAWWVLTPFFLGLCRRLADADFVVLAPDLYHGATATTIAEAKKLRSQLDRDRAHQEMLAAVDYLHQHTS